MMMINFYHAFTSSIYLSLPYFADVGSGGIGHLFLGFMERKNSKQGITVVYKYTSEKVSERCSNPV